MPSSFVPRARLALTRSLVQFAAAIAALCLAACGEGGGARAPAEDEAGLVILHRGNGTEPDSLDPHKAAGTWENNIIGDMLIGLMTEDQAGDAIYGAAVSHTVSEDGLVYTFKLRDAMTWSDGVPVTADDFVFAFQRILDPQTAAQYASLVYPVKNAEAINTGQAEPDSVGVRAVDPKTLEITLAAPAPYLLQLLTHYTTFPLPKHAVEALGDDWIKPGNIVVNGPYRVTEWRPQSHVKAVKNPLFYDADSVEIDVVYYYPTDDVSAALRRFRAGELDLTTDFPMTQRAWLEENMPGAARPEIQLSTSYIALNTQVPPFDDVRVRNALSLAVDREALTSSILINGEQPAYALVPPGINNYVADPPQMADADLTQEARNEKARALLAEAGFGPDNPLSFTLTFRNASDRKRVIVALQDMWKRIGVEVKLRGQEVKVAYNSFRSGDFQAGDAGWVADYSDPDNFLFLLQTSSGAMNYGQYSNPEFDALVERAGAMTDLAARAELLAEAERMALADQPLIPIYFGVNRSLVGPHVEGWTANPMSLHRTRYLSLNEAKRP